METREEKVKTLLEFCRVKVPELNARHAQLARVFLIFFVLDVALFLTIFETKAGVSLNLPDSFELNVSTSTAGAAVSAAGGLRPLLVFGLATFLLIYFLRFGYLYYQGTRDVINMHSAIGSFLPPAEDEPLEYKYIRRGLAQSCKINYIVQTLTVFAFPRREQLTDEGKKIHEDERLPFFEVGPLADPTGYGPNSAGWEILTKIFMYVIIFSVAVLIAIAQIMIIVVMSSVLNYLLLWAIFVSFVSFYIIYGFFITKLTRGTGDFAKLKFPGLSKYLVMPMAWILIATSLISNIFLLINNSDVSNIPVLTEKVSRKEITDNSWVTGAYLQFLLKK